MLRKIITIIYRITLLQLLVRWFILGKSWILFFAGINILMIYFFSSSWRTWINEGVSFFLVDVFHINKNQCSLLKNSLRYIFQRYILMFSIIYIMLGILDYCFAHVLFLNMRWGFFVGIVSVIILHKDILHGEIRLGDRRIGKSDIPLIISILLMISLMIFFRQLPFYQSYAYSIIFSWIVWILLMIIMGYADWRKVIKIDIFWIGMLLSIIFMVLYAWYDFPIVKNYFTVERVVYQTWSVYIDCPNTFSEEK